MAECSTCDDSGLVLDGTGDHGEEFYRPCHICRPESYALYLGGHLDSGHSCPECAERRGNAKPARRSRRRVVTDEDQPQQQIEYRDFTEPAHRDEDRHD